MFPQHVRMAAGLGCSYLEACSCPGRRPVLGKPKRRARLALPTCAPAAPDDANRWTEIAAAKRWKITGPNLVYVGQALGIPVNRARFEGPAPHVISGGAIRSAAVAILIFASH